MGAQFCSPGGDVVCGTKKDHPLNKLRLAETWKVAKFKAFASFDLFDWRFSYAFLGNSAKLSRSSKASAGGIQRHRRLGKAQPQERAAESPCTETLL